MNGRTRALRALALARQGNWDQVHELVQEDEKSFECCWVHAAFHRYENDFSNASYWYQRAGQKPPPKHVSSLDEIEAIENALKTDPAGGTSQ